MSEQNNKTSKSWVLALVSIASCMVALDAMVVTTALSAIRVSLGASLESLEWTVNAYNLSFAVLLLTGTALGDRFGRRRMFCYGIVLFAGGSAACGLATTVGWLIAARALQGAGAALVVPLAMALLGAAFSREERGKALGVFSGVTGVALIGGPVIGGAIAQGLAWQWIFWINLPIAAIVIPLAARRIDESFGSGSALDIPGIALVTGSALGLAWGLMRGNNAGWSSVEVVATLGAGLLLAAAFVGWELRAREPMVPMRFFRSSAFASGIGSSFFFYASMYGVLFLLPQFLQTAQGHGAFEAGVRLLPWTATLFVVAPFAGKLVNRIGERPLVVGGLILQALGMAWIGLIVAPDLAYAQLVAPMVFAGAGVSMAMPAAQNAVLGSVAGSEIGKASGTFNMLRYLGGVFGVAVLVAVFAHTGNIHSAKAFSEGFAVAIGVSAGLSVVAAIAGLWLPRAATAAGSTMTVVVRGEAQIEPAMSSHQADQT
ncbi:MULTISPECIES: MFS transporter [unclassified Rhizobium]|uniref:MFS transporter n=1 Tax=unclassified Rhizobium TaxID=2613769 RepID=UPI000EA8F50E|nr:MULTISPECIES: MFS transporter [unclassified Rhizobium]AYG64936.1 DHA2 family efflux MFS transporter permease subunit [Rhizobium sp. CCGE531]AYG71421.1 DHA2 family efflux MFS transporter permease subunit [Rhizobium sp. CCGE532]